MTRFKNFFLINIYFIFFSTISFADNKIAYINVDLILSQSKPSKSLFLQLKKNEENKFEQFKKNEKILREEENKIISTKKIISKEEFNKSVSNFKNKLEIYQNKKKKEIVKFYVFLN